MISRINSPYQLGRLNQIAKRKAQGGFVPTDIAGCKLWLDFADADTLFTDNGVTKVTTDGDLIYRVNDKSGNGYNAVQTTNIKRFKYGANQQNGLSAGVSDDTAQGYSVSIPIQSRPRAAFLVLRPTKENATDFKYSTFGDLLTYGKPTNFKVRTGNWVHGVNGNKPINAWYVISVILNEDNSYLRINGTQMSAPTGSLYSQTSEIVIGFPTAVDNVNGFYAECIFYSGDKLSDCATIESYLNNKWNIY